MQVIFWLYFFAIFPFNAVDTTVKRLFLSRLGYLFFLYLVHRHQQLYDRHSQLTFVKLWQRMKVLAWNYFGFYIFFPESLQVDKKPILNYIPKLFFSSNTIIFTFELLPKTYINNTLVVYSPCHGWTTTLNRLPSDTFIRNT